MSVVESTLHVPRVTRTPALLDFLQMLTGAALILFMWSHMILVSSVLVGPEVMNAIAAFFEATYMAQVGGPIIGAGFLLHFVLASRKLPFRVSEQRVIWRHAKMLRHPDTWMWVVQAVTAMIILIMGAIHMWVVLTTLPITAAKSAGRIQEGFWLVFYVILLPMVELHVGIGFFRIGVKWGWVKRGGRRVFGGIEKLLTLFFLTIGVLTLVRFYTLVG
ncbi:MAG: succinate dehydrogenase/fumarate reductase cytochrome b subunit [Dehalococcoidia bacterium]